MTIRRGTNCVKWDAESPVGPISEDVIPLWVADMDFKVAPEIVNVLKDRVDQEIFGYTHVPDSYYEAAVNWWERRRGWHTEKDWYLYIAGVVPAMSVVVKALTQYEIVDGEVVEKPNRGRGPHGELPKMIIQSPAYNCFFSTAKNNLCELSINKLIYDTEGDQAIGTLISRILRDVPPTRWPRCCCSAILTTLADVSGLVRTLRG